MGGLVEEFADFSFRFADEVNAERNTPTRQRPDMEVMDRPDSGE